jgi:hypothetical protein
MARIPTSAAALDPPVIDPDEFVPIEQQLKREFRIEGQWNKADRKEILIGLGFALGRHRLEAERPTGVQVRARIQGVIKAIDQIQKILGREAGGFLPSDTIAQEAWFRIMEYLGQHPGIGSREKAGAAALNWCQILEDLRHACHLALVELKGVKGERHRDALMAYDDFVNVLLFAASRLRIRTSISDDRIRGRPTGPFYRLAELMEEFLPREMQSPSPAARKKRLERSQARLRGQKPKK